MYSVRIQVAALFGGPLYAKLLGIFVGLALHHLLSQRLRYIAVECLGHHRKLCKLRHRLYARYDGYGDTHLACLLHKSVVFLVVKKQLCHCILRTQVLLLLQILHVHLKVRRLFVLLGIAGHSIVEWSSRVLYGCSVGKVSLVELLHLLHQVGGVRVSARCRLESAILLGLVAS